MSVCVGPGILNCELFVFMCVCMLQSKCVGVGVYVCVRHCGRGQRHRTTAAMRVLFVDKLAGPVLLVCLRV